MPRLPRIIDPHGTYHIVARGNNREAIFHCRQDFSSYLRILKEQGEQHKFDIHHYVLMSNHVHFTLRLHGGTPLPRIMQYINQGYARYYKRRYKTVGHLWQGRYHSSLITADAYLLVCGAYIHLNPVRAGVTAMAEEYEWTSYRAYGLQEPNGLIKFDPAYLEMGRNPDERRAAYREFVRCQPPRRLAPMWKNGKIGR